MVICIIGLIVFAIAGIFSARYRRLAKEAFSCTFKKLTFRACDTGLDIRIKAHITAKLIKWPSIARFVHRNFERISVILVIIMLITFAWSGFYAADGVYKYAKYGNCNGPNSNEFCIFNIAGAAEHKIGTVQCNDIYCECVTPTVNCSVGGNYNTYMDFTPCVGSVCSCP
jgi:hypothetical protein